MQILEIKKLSLSGTVLDVGSKESLTNVTNYLKTQEKIIYADKHSKNPKDLNIDLEKTSDFGEIKFNNVLLFNVLEHIFNYKNCLKNCYTILRKDGFFCGSTPFFFRIHGSPNDYFRYTEQSILKLLKETGFSELKIKVLDGGIFICFFSSISNLTNKIPLFNNLLLIICNVLDFIILLFAKNIKSSFPLGYFFQGKK